MQMPIMGKPDPVSSEPTKKRFGTWVVSLLKVLRALKGLRGTPFDIFGYSGERVLERRLIVEYADRMRGLLARLSVVNYDVAVEIASIPERIRGYGHIKRRHLAEVKPKEAELLVAFEHARPEVVAAEWG